MAVINNKKGAFAPFSLSVLDDDFLHDIGVSTAFYLHSIDTHREMRKQSFVSRVYLGFL
jgi:hypothetical protein